MKALFIAQYGPRAASSRTRVFDYVPLLREQGVYIDLEVVAPDDLVVLLQSEGRLDRLFYYVQSWWRTFSMGWMCVLRASKYDVVFIQKVLFPFPVPRMLRRFRSRIVFDFDDAIFTTEAPREGLLSRLRARRRADGLPPMLKAACHVVIENAYTGAYAEKFGCAVSRITGPIDTQRYSPGPRQDKQEGV